MTHRPITDELVCLKHAIDLLKVAEDMVQPENFERYRPHGVCQPDG